MAGVLLNLIPALLLGAIGCWSVPLDWAAWAAIAAAGAWWNRSRLAERRSAAISLAVSSVAIAAVLAVPSLLPVRSEWAAGGWDPGMYQNYAVAIANRNGWTARTDTALSALTAADRMVLCDTAELPYAELMPAVPVRLRDGALPIYFPPLTPVCGAWFYRTGGFAMLARMPALIAFLGLLPFLSLCGMLGLNRLQGAAALGFIFISPMWWYHQAIPTSEMLYLLLLYGGLVSYLHAMRDHRRIPVAAMLVLFAATINHFNAMFVAGILLVVAAGAESALNLPRRQWRLMCCFGALLAGLCWGLHFAWVTLSRLQEKDAALSLIMATLLLAGVLAAVASWRHHPSLLSASRHPLTRLALLAPVLGMLLLTVLLSAGKTRDVVLHLSGAIPLIGAFPYYFGRLLDFHGTAWFLLVLAGVWLLIMDRPSGVFSRASLPVLALGGILALLLARPGITPIYPWALRRYMVVAVPFMALAQACAAGWALEAGRSRTVWRMALLALAALAAAGGLKMTRHAVRVGDYAGLPAALERLDRQLQPGDVVVTDDARWGTPLLLLHDREVLNGERLLNAGDPSAFLDVIRRVQARHDGRILWLTSRAAGLDAYPVLPDCIEAVGDALPFEYRTVIHGRDERRFRMESRQAVFRLYEQMAVTEPPLTVPRPGPCRLLFEYSGDRPEGAILLQWGGLDVAEIQPRDGWRVLDLPASSPDPQPVLNWSWSPGQGSPPQFMLFAPGDPLELILWHGRLYPAGARIPERSATGDASVFPLPFLPGADAIQVYLSADAPPAAPVAVRVSLGSESRDVQLNRRTSSVSWLFAAGDAASVGVETSGTADSPRLRLGMQPLYSVLSSIPAKTGIHVFQTFDRSGIPSVNIARRLIAGEPVRVEAGEGRLAGQCIFFLSGDAPHCSDLNDDELVRFRRFHEREATGDQRRPYQRWSAAGEAEIEIAAPPDADVLVTLRLRDVRPPGLAGASAAVHAGAEAYPVVFSNAVWTAALRLPAGASRDHGGDSVTVRLVGDTWTPAAVAPSGDHRTLGMLLDELAVSFSVPDAAGFAHGRSSDDNQDR